MCRVWFLVFILWNIISELTNYPLKVKEFLEWRAALRETKYSLVMERFLEAGKELIESGELSTYKRWLCHPV